MHVHLLDGTYELFRHHFGRPEPGPYGATRGVLGTVLMMLSEGATHLGVASDHVIESFRNDLWEGYKTSEGMPPELLAQIPILEGALSAMGVTVWPMVEWEADDAMASAAAIASADTRVERVFICTPDKDLAQCVVDDRVVQVDRRRNTVIGVDGVVEKFGVQPESIPDYLALVGDSADGFPGLPGWGSKSTAQVLSVYRHLENIPPAAGQWDVPGLKGGAKLSKSLQDHQPHAYLFRRLATLERDVPVGAVDEWRWAGPHEAFAEVCERLGDDRLLARARRLGKR
jgi:5'-3' exonuclease